MSQSDPAFSLILASSVHDMKNFLSTVLESLDWLSGRLGELEPEQFEEMQKINTLISRVNGDLMQLLCLYKFENNQYPLALRTHDLDEFLELQQAFLQPMLKNNNYRIDVKCEDESLTWKFDEILVSSAIRNAGMNALKYAKTVVQLSAKAENGSLILTVEDDGPGYPESMLGEIKDLRSSFNFSTGSTGLGLFFAEKVAELHSQRGINGHIELSNSSTLGGGIFKLILG